jgi:hypothetical protein
LLLPPSLLASAVYNPNMLDHTNVRDENMWLKARETAQSRFSAQRKSRRRQK